MLDATPTSTAGSGRCFVYADDGSPVPLTVGIYRWGDSEWFTLVDAPHPGGFGIRQTVTEVQA